MSETEKNGYQAIQEILNKIWAKSQKDGRHISQYVFRGEPEKYSQCSSSLYRELKEEEGEENDQEFGNQTDKDALYDTQKDFIKEARDYVDKEGNKIDVLAKLRHYDGFINLIDFTSDCLIALYFACRSDAGEHGRLIMLLEKPREDLGLMDSNEEYVTYKSKIKDNRLLTQRSVFVHSLKGYIDLNKDNIEIITIEKEEKKDILECLSETYSISHRALFDDLHGCIDSQRNRLKAIKHLRVCLACVEERDHSGTIACYDKAIELDPEFAGAYINRGDIYVKQGNDDRAIADYSKAIKLDPKYAKAYYNRGNAYAEKGEYDRAIADYTKVVELNSKDAQAYYNRGLAYAKQGKYDQAIADYSKAIELDAKYAKAYYNRGNAYAEKGEYDRAIADYSKAIELNPKYAAAYYSRGNAYARKRSVPNFAIG